MERLCKVFQNAFFKHVSPSGELIPRQPPPALGASVLKLEETLAKDYSPLQKNVHNWGQRQTYPTTLYLKNVVQLL